MNTHPADPKHVSMANTEEDGPFEEDRKILLVSTKLRTPLRGVLAILTNKTNKKSYIQQANALTFVIWYFCKCTKILRVLSFRRTLDRQESSMSEEREQTKTTHLRHCPQKQKGRRSRRSRRRLDACGRVTIHAKLCEMTADIREHLIFGAIRIHLTHFVETAEMLNDGTRLALVGLQSLLDGLYVVIVATARLPSL